MKNMSIYRLNELLAEPPSPPCVSIYQPTHRRHPDNQQDPIRFRNLVAEAEASLRREHPGREVRPILEPLRPRDRWPRVCRSRRATRAATIVVGR